MYVPFQISSFRYLDGVSFKPGEPGSRMRFNIHTIPNSLSPFPTSLLIVSRGGRNLSMVSPTINSLMIGFVSTPIASDPRLTLGRKRKPRGSQRKIGYWNMNAIKKPHLLALLMPDEYCIPIPNLTRLTRRYHMNSIAE